MENLVVLGAGESGCGAAILGKKKGFNVFVSDKGTISKKSKDVLSHNNIPFEEEKHSERQILDADLVIKSPGIPDTIPLIQVIEKQGIPIIDELEFASRYYQKPIIAITGSNGKTTTTLLTSHIFKKAGKKVIVAGNIGKSLAKQVAEEIESDLAIIEISSFQLDRIEEFKPHIAILLNITPDHLDRYNDDFEQYTASKLRITKNQSDKDYLIYNIDDSAICRYLESTKTRAQLIPFSLEKREGTGAWIDNKDLIINIKTGITMSIQKLALQGKHNLYNSMAAGVAGRILELRKEIIRESLNDFQNIEHRLETVTQVCGVSYINDSKATNVNSTWYALESMEEKTVWIVGGVDKGNDYDSLIPLVKDKVKAIVCLGVDNSKIHAAFGHLVEDIFDTQSMYDAVRAAYSLAKKGDSVLLSPACASFDLFENYEDRGRQFKEAAKGL